MALADSVVIVLCFRLRGSGRLCSDCVVFQAPWLWQSSDCVFQAPWFCSDCVVFQAPWLCVVIVLCFRLRGSGRLCSDCVVFQPPWLADSVVIVLCFRPRGSGRL